MKSKFNKFGAGMVGVVLVMLGLAAVFGLCEPTPASANIVTSGDVRLVSERLVTQPDADAKGQCGQSGRAGRHDRCFIR